MQQDTILMEEKYFVPFFNKIPISIERGDGIYVWDEDGKRYIDFTSGWGVTCLGHASPVIIEAITSQSRKIIQNPSSGLTYSPPRARLLGLMADILPGKLSRLFFSNSGAESNDAVIKLARKISGKTDVISTEKSFHGRTISTVSATGQAKHRDKFNPLVPGFRFVPYNDIHAMTAAMDKDVAAVILEPVQGEGGVNIPDSEYLEKISQLCEKNNTFLIIDEVQTGFCRTGSMFAITDLDIKVDFMTMAKGIAGGFPFGAFAVSEDVAQKIEKGDHGGTYCGNPLGCAVAYAVIKHMVDNEIENSVRAAGKHITDTLKEWQDEFPGLIKDIRGKGLLIAMEIRDEKTAGKIYKTCLKKGLFINVTQGNIIRLFPALNITDEEADEGLDILGEVIASIKKT
ncbi:MAG: acetylornithine transaminase [Desulfobacterales bacterium]|nr:acetylornithine transaminase [Desulfobacterales bacterium]